MSEALNDHVDVNVIHEAVKPVWRGLLHHIFFYVAVAAGALLVSVANSTRGAFAGLVYCLSLAGMFGFSAAYHRAKWGPVGRERMRRLDHAAIFLLIAGTYTPVAALGVPGPVGTGLLWVAWIGAALGVAHSLFFTEGLRSLNAVLYVVFGCLILPVLPAVVTGMGPWRTLLIVAGGAVYISGAAVYGRKWPNPSFRVFGYHEVFHAMVVAASALHFAAVLSLVREVA